MISVYAVGSPYWRKYLSSSLQIEGEMFSKTVDFGDISSIIGMFGSERKIILLVGLGVDFSIKRYIIFFVSILARILRPKRTAIVNYWIGSDVKSINDGMISRLMVWVMRGIGVRHICGAPWFLAPLAAGGITATSILFPYDDEPARSKPFVQIPAPPVRFCTYLTEAGWSNLSGSVVLEMAHRLPDTRWTVFGMDKSGVPSECKVPPNVTFVGWVSDTLNVLAESHIFVRLAKSDAYAGTVRDALAMNKTVVYTMPVSGVFNVAELGLDELSAVIEDICTTVRSGTGLDVEMIERDGAVLPPFQEQVENLVRFLKESD